MQHLIFGFNETIDYLMDNVCQLVKVQTVSLYLHFPFLLAETRLGAGGEKPKDKNIYKVYSKILRTLQEDHPNIKFIRVHTVGQSSDYKAII